MGKKASAQDAELILKLYDLRREPELRKARNWWLWEFSPRNADDFLKVANAGGSLRDGDKVTPITADTRMGER